MIKRLYLTKQDVVDWAQSAQHPSHVFLSQRKIYLDGSSGRLHSIDQLPDRIAVRAVNTGLFNPSSKLGMYEIMQEARNSGYSSLVLPKNLTTVEEVPDVFDALDKTLKQELPNRHYVWRDPNTDACSLYMYYPEITITNTIGDGHTIYDLVVRLNSDDGVNFHSLAAKRFSYDTDELRVGYNHSHLQTSLHQWVGFCFGSTKFATFINVFYRSPTPDNLSLFLTQFDAYLAWESLEGKPYKSISELRLANESSGLGNLMSSIQRTKLAKMIISKLTPDMLGLVNNIWQVVPKLCMDKLLQFEIEAIQELNLGLSYLQPYSLNTHTYIAANNSRNNSLPALDTLGKELVAAFKFTPRVVQVKAEGGERIVQRATRSDAQYIIEEVNNLLTNGYKIND